MAKSWGPGIRDRDSGKPIDSGWQRVQRGVWTFEWVAGTRGKVVGYVKPTAYYLFETLPTDTWTETVNRGPTEGPYPTIEVARVAYLLRYGST